jgi:hypothetical protein
MPFPAAGQWRVGWNDSDSTRTAGRALNARPFAVTIRGFINFSLAGWTTRGTVTKRCRCRIRIAGLERSKTQMVESARAWVLIASATAGARPVAVFSG